MIEVCEPLAEDHVPLDFFSCDNPVVKASFDKLFEEMIAKRWLYAGGLVTRYKVGPLEWSDFELSGGFFYNESDGRYYHTIRAVDFRSRKSVFERTGPLLFERAIHCN